MQSILTICIPTYNREKELQGNLEHLVKAYNHLSEKEKKMLNFFISDNHSDNYDIEKLLYSFQKLFPFEYISHNENLGATKNFEYCYRKFNSKYIWLLSDDEFLYDYSLKYLLNIVLVKDPDIIFINFAKNKNKKYKDEIITNKDLFVSKVKNKPTLISSLIFKKKLINNIEPKFLDTNLHHYYYFLQGVIDSHKFYLVNKDIFFSLYPNNSGGYNWFHTFGNELYDIIDDIDKQNVISKKIFSDIKKTILTSQLIPNFFHLKIKTEFIKNFSQQSLNSIFINIFNRNQKFLETWIYLIPIYLIPYNILLKIKSLYDWKKENG